MSDLREPMRIKGMLISFSKIYKNSKWQDREEERISTFDHIFP